VVHTAWRAHRALYRLSGGRFLWTTSNKRGWGALRLTTIGRKSGQARSVIIGYLEDGPNRPAGRIAAGPVTTAGLPEGLPVASGADLSSAGNQLADDLAELVDRDRQMTLLGEQHCPRTRQVGRQPLAMGERDHPILPALQKTTGTLMLARSNPHGRVKARSSSNQPQMPLATAWRNDAAT
jgi:hypothetical protein